MRIQTRFTEIFGTDLPLLVAPMFLVSNVAMLVEAFKAGAIGAVPSLNYRTPELFRDALKSLKREQIKKFGVNLIVQNTNPFYKEHLKVSLEEGVPFFITSLGNPKMVIDEAHKIGAKVFCDVVNLEFAQKVIDLGADGVIAVSSGAGGHAGPVPANVLVPALKNKFKNIPIVAAGGVASGASWLSMMALGADAVSVGTRFIATTEAPVIDAYKNAILKAGLNDIVYTEKLSGTPCSVIRTPYVEKMGLHQNFFDRLMNRHKTLRKYYKMLIQYRGLKLLEKAALAPTYKDVWCAGQSAALVNEILPVGKIIEEWVREYEVALDALPRPARSV